MSNKVLDKKIDFIMIFDVKSANPNGDPLNGNMPRQDDNGFGEISDVCIKRKIRNRFQDLGKEIFVKSNDRADDGISSLQKRYENNIPDRKNMDDENLSKLVCEKWIDVRSFGQVFTFDNRAFGVRGPVSILPTSSAEEIAIKSLQITKSVNGLEKNKGERASDTIGMKHYVNYGLYILKGSVNVFFAEKTGFTYDDLETLKEALKTLFYNDMSAARPEGSMNVRKIYWFEHSSKLGDVATINIHELLEVENITGKEPLKYSDYNISLNEEYLEIYKKRGVKFEEIKVI